MDTLQPETVGGQPVPDTSDISRESPFRQELFTLMQKDGEIRQLIYAIANTQENKILPLSAREPEVRVVEKIVEVEKIIEIEKPVEVIKEVVKVVEKPNPLRQSLNQELRFLAAVNQDVTMRQQWLTGVGSEEGQQLVQLLARAAQWDEILNLWDQLANRCKEQQRVATEAELLILTSALAVHNRIWQGRAALLKPVGSDQFDFEHHERVGLKGEKITGECLPGLSNAAGKLQRKCLVKTLH